MPEKIRYDDNIYFLTALIRALHDAVRLHVDAEYFADKVLEDTLFIDAAIQKMYSSLRDNARLIRRDSYLHSIMLLKKSYGRLIEDLLTTEGDFARPFEPMRPKLSRMAATHMNEAKAIRETLGSAADGKNEGDVISSDELHFLMSPMDDDAS